MIMPNQKLTLFNQYPTSRDVPTFGSHGHMLPVNCSIKVFLNNPFPLSLQASFPSEDAEDGMLKNLKKNMKNLKTNYGGTPQFIL